MVYATLTDLGVRTSGFPSNNPCSSKLLGVWRRLCVQELHHDLQGRNFAHRGAFYDKLNADNHQYFDGGKLLPGAVVSGIAKDNGIGHMWFYMGEFKNRDAVLDYLVKLGYKRDSVSKYVGGNGNGGKHWRIECNGSQGALSTITPMARRDLKSFVAYKLTSREATFSIKKCIDGTSQIVGKSAVDGSFAKYGVYSDKACKTKVGEIKIGEKGTGSIKLKSGTYYVKEISARKATLCQPRFTS